MEGAAAPTALGSVAIEVPWGGLATATPGAVGVAGLQVMLLVLPGLPRILIPLGASAALVFTWFLLFVFPTRGNSGGGVAGVVIIAVRVTAHALTQC